MALYTFPFIGIYAIRYFFKRPIHFAPKTENKAIVRGKRGTATKIAYIIYVSFTIYHVFTHTKNNWNLSQFQKEVHAFICWAAFRLHYSVHIFRTLIFFRSLFSFSLHLLDRKTLFFPTIPLFLYLSLCVYAYMYVYITLCGWPFLFHFICQYLPHFFPTRILHLAVSFIGSFVYFVVYIYG